MIFHRTNCKINHSCISQMNQESRMINSDRFTNTAKYGACAQTLKVQNMIIHLIITLRISSHQVKTKHAGYSNTIVKWSKMNLRVYKY